MSNKSTILLMIAFSIMLFSFENTYADKSVEIEVKYTNGDRVDHNEMKVLVYQDFNDKPILEKKFKSNPDFITIPENHRYKIEVYVNGIYGDVEYIPTENNSEKLNIDIPLPGGIQFGIFYKDGQIPIKDATIIVKTHDNAELRKGKTNDQGETIRYWIQSTTKQDEYYTLDIYLDELFLMSYSPIKLLPGISTDQKITTNIPEYIQSLISIKLYNGTKLMTNTDGEYEITLTNRENKEIISKTNLRGEAQFSNLKTGTYVVKIHSNNTDTDDLWPETKIDIVGNPNTFNIYMIGSKNPTSSGNLGVESCNCVAFRLDDIQDYWLNDVQIGIMNVFVEKKFPLTIGVIADSFGLDPKMTDFVKQGKNKNILKIASHGVGNTPFTEYSIEEQDNKLKESLQKIKSSLDVTTKIFIPPQNRYNEDTKQALVNNGFTHISSSLLRGEPPPFPLKDQELFQFPETSTTGTFDPDKNAFVGVPYKETLRETLNGLEKYGFAVITSHPQDFSTIVNGTYTNTVNLQQISELEILIEKIKQIGIDIVTIDQINTDSQNTGIPMWVKDNAGWWAEGSIDDETFVQGIEYMIQEKMINVSEQFNTLPSEQRIPMWVKDNAGWWAEGSIDDETFVQGIEYMIKNGIIVY